MTLEIRDCYDEIAFDALKQQIEDLRASKKEGWQEMAVKLIRQSRLDDPELELKRLRFFNILNPTSEPLLKKSIEGLAYGREKKDLMIMVARAMEIQKIYEETHHVFIHAQSSQWLIYPDLVKELMKLVHPEQDMHQFKFLRMPNLERPWDITRYSKAFDVYDHETTTRTDLISADGYFYHNGAYESALDFMSRNENISSPSYSTLSEVIEFFIPGLDPFVKDPLIKKLLEKVKAHQSKIGNLFVICIPKEKSEEIQYRSHPFGKPCTCHLSSQDIPILEQLQKGKLNYKAACSEYDPCPQFRIFTPELKKENGVKIYLLTQDRLQRKKTKELVRKAIQELSTFYKNLENNLAKS